MFDSEFIIDTTVPCKICEKLTTMLGTKLCDSCWELQRRIEDNPVLARKILEMIENVEESLEDDLSEATEITDNS